MITTCLWFSSEAEEAANYYTSIFPGGKILSISRFGKEGREFHGQPEGQAMAVKFRIHGQDMCALNGNNRYRFNESISMQIHLETREEIDNIWNAITLEGTESMCGWCKDKYGVSWQILPSSLGEIMSHPVHGLHATKAMMSMKKIIIKDLLGA